MRNGIALLVIIGLLLWHHFLLCTFLGLLFLHFNLLLSLSINHLKFLDLSLSRYLEIQLFRCDPWHDSPKTSKQGALTEVLLLIIQLHLMP